MPRPPGPGHRRRPTRSGPGPGTTTTVRASRSAAGVRKKRPPGEPEDHVLGRSRGGFSTGLHLVCDRAMLPLGFVLTPGQQYEATVAPDLVR